jgi:A/G-specific adenine glycosylase
MTAARLTADLLGRVEPRHVRAAHGPLLAWFDGARRPMPWREPGPDGRRDAYRVWISEVMLQQTRVETVVPYYERFLARFPTVQALAAAPLDDVLKLWEGLGYYSRARNLHRAAQEVAAARGGTVPADPDAFRALPGVGPYTAAAVLSIAHGEPLAVLDGNVIRVLTRVFAVEHDARAGATRRALQEVATRLLPPADAARFNEALMELGATLCTPRSPACDVCPLGTVCAARALGAPETFPVQSARAPVPHKTIAVGLITDDDGRVLVQRRPEDGMLGGLWEFPGGKQEPGEPLDETCRREIQEELGVDVHVGPLVATVNHAYTHFTVTIHAYRCALVAGEPVTETGEPIQWVTPDEAAALAFPRANRRIIDQLVADARAPRLW